MRLDFNVLWVDDQPENVDGQINTIKRRMEQEGFEFVAVQCQSMADVRARLADDVFADEVDLILVDWDLGGGTHGQQVIAEIRQAIAYKDVVFYSARTEPDILRKLAFDEGVEGIYCASRDDLVEEVMGVFDSLVKKVLDLDHTRGIVMGATSDIDHMVNEALRAIHDGMDSDGRKAMLNTALGHIERRITDLGKMLEKLRGATGLADFFEEHMILTANDRLRMLADALKSGPLKNQRQYRTAVVTYQQKVVPGRNILGHMLLVPNGKPQQVVDNSGKPISLDETRELRRLILGLRGDFRGLLAALKTAG